MVTISVTEDDILKGKPRSSNHCPIARAANRVHHAEDVRVYYCGILTSRGRIPLPQSATDFITRFDVGLKVSPFSFTIPTI